ncbi:hypothetical protein ACRXCV_05125 [Halobacteriovorax sp. GFR7]|uniref:hypothetical protein n=1 Tax=unclassified Halobacteriovorax TaxID=2639665 RepID=UPI003D97419F
MKSKLLFLLLFSAFSAQAYVCTSDANPTTKFIFNYEGNQLFSGKIVESTNASIAHEVFVGKSVKFGYPTNIYELYNQEGEKLELSMKFPPISGGHCRARVCPPLPPQSKIIIAKLTDSEGNDEYFNCL